MGQLYVQTIGQRNLPFMLSEHLSFFLLNKNTTEKVAPTCRPTPWSAYTVLLDASLQSRQCEEYTHSLLGDVSGDSWGHLSPFSLPPVPASYLSHDSCTCLVSVWGGLLYVCGIRAQVVPSAVSATTHRSRWSVDNLKFGNGGQG